MRMSAGPEVPPASEGRVEEKKVSLKTAEGTPVTLDQLRARVSELGGGTEGQLFAPIEGGGFCFTASFPGDRKFLVTAPARSWRRSARSGMEEGVVYLEEVAFVPLFPTEKIPLPKQVAVVEQHLQEALQHGLRQGFEIEFLLYPLLLHEAQRREQRSAGALSKDRLQRLLRSLIDAVLPSYAQELLLNMREIASAPKQGFLAMRDLFIDTLKERVFQEALRDERLLVLLRSMPPYAPDTLAQVARPWRLEDVSEAESKQRAFAEYVQVIATEMQKRFMNAFESVVRSSPTFQSLRHIVDQMEEVAQRLGYQDAWEWIRKKGLEAWQVLSQHHSISVPQDPRSFLIPEVPLQNTLNLLNRFSHLIELLGASGGFAYGTTLRLPIRIDKDGNLHIASQQEEGVVWVPILDARFLWRMIALTSAPPSIIPPDRSLAEIALRHHFVEGATSTFDRGAGDITVRLSTPTYDFRVDLPPLHSAFRTRVALPAPLVFALLEAERAGKVEEAKIAQLRENLLTARIEYTGHPSTPDLRGHFQAVALQNVLHLLGTIASAELLAQAEKSGRLQDAKDIFGWLASNGVISREEAESWYRMDTDTLRRLQDRAAIGAVPTEEIEILLRVVQFTEEKAQARVGGELSEDWREVFYQAHLGLRSLRKVSALFYRGSHRGRFGLERYLEKLREKYSPEAIGPYVFDWKERADRGVPIFGLISLLTDEELRAVLKDRLGVKEIVVLDENGKEQKLPLDAVTNRAVLESVTAHFFLLRTLEAEA